MGAGEISQGLAYAPDIQSQWAFTERMLGLAMGRFFRVVAYQSRAWREQYDGPQSCHTYNGKSHDGNWLYINANTVCAKGACAGHTSVVVQSYFARQAVQRISSFIKELA